MKVLLTLSASDDSGIAPVVQKSTPVREVAVVNAEIEIGQAFLAMKDSFRFFRWKIGR